MKKLSAILVMGMVLSTASARDFEPVETKATSNSGENQLEVWLEKYDELKEKQIELKEKQAELKAWKYLHVEAGITSKTDDSILLNGKKAHLGVAIVQVHGEERGIVVRSNVAINNCRNAKAVLEVGENLSVETMNLVSYTCSD